MKTDNKGGTTDFGEMDNRLINYLLLIGSVFGLFALASTLFVDNVEWYFRAFHVFGVSGAAILYYFRDRLSVKLKVDFLIFMLLIVVMGGVVRDGPRSTVTLLMILISFMTLLVYDRNRSIAIYSACVLIYWIIGLFGRYFYDRLGNSSEGVWIAHGMLLIMVGLLIQLYLSTYIASLKHLLEKANQSLGDLKASRRELEKTKTLLENAIAHSPSGIMIADADSVQLSLANEAAFFIHGGKSEILKGIDLEAYTGEWEVLHTDNRPYRSEELPLHRALVEGEYVQNDEAIIRVPSTGQEHWISANAAPIHDTDGKIISAIVLFHDISEIKKIQRDLENLVAERTAKLELSYQHLNEQNEQLERSLSELKEAQSQLVRSEKMASLGILIAGVGHEINNPLNFVQGGVVGISKYIEDHKALNGQLNDIVPFVESIEEGVRRASKIVRSLTRVSRQNKAVNEQCRIHEIVENCLVMLHNKLKDRIEVKRQYEQEDLVLMGNEGKLHQIFMNILANAEQAIEGEGSITIRTYTKDQMAFIEVEDSGTGIAREHLEKIGDPFFTTKEPGAGVGLGLYIVHTILEELHGDWYVHSQESKGTTFTITLPLSGH